MLTDDDLIRELSAEFRRNTDDIVYRGRTRPPRPVLTLVPAAAMATAVAGGGVAVVLSDDARAPGGDGLASPAATASAEMVTETVRLAGFALTYQRPVGAARPFDRDGSLARIDPRDIPREVPTSARSIELDGAAPVEAWVYPDPATGLGLLYLKVIRSDRMAVLVSDVPADALAGYLHDGRITIDGGEDGSGITVDGAR